MGYPEIVLERAVEVGIARSKTDAVRLGVLALNQQYHLLEGSAEDELVIRKMRKMEEENRKAGKKPETMAQVLAKYPDLKLEK